jgi:hypothetical protein
MTAINFQSQYRGIKGCQGHVFSGPTPTSTYQTQYHAPLHPDYTGLPNGRVVYVNRHGELTPECPADAPKKFAMPLLLCEGGAKIADVYATFRQGLEAPYRTAIPQPNPNVMALPLCTGYEHLSTEFDPDKNYTYNMALTSIGNVNDVTSGMIVPLTEDTEMCIGFVSQQPGKPRQYGDPARFAPDVPNPMLAVTGKNHSGLAFWGHPLPCGAVTN